MFIKLNQRLQKGDKGFTLIELLVVILIIAILAAIAIPVFLNQRKKGWVAQMESALKNATTAQESFLVGNNVYADTQGEMEGEGWKFAADVFAIVANIDATGGGNSYCVALEHKTLSDDAIEPMAISSVVTTPTKNRGCTAGVMGTTAVAMTANP